MKKSESTRRERAKADKRRRILDASRKLFAEFGFERTTVQQIADAADVAVGTLFLYVRDKSELVLLLFGDRLEAQVSVSRKQLQSPRRRLRSAILAFFGDFLALYEEDPELSRLFWSEFLSAKPESRAQLDAINNSVMEALYARVARAIAETEIGADIDPGSAALHLYAIFQATISFHLVNCAPLESSEKTLAVLLDSFWRGLRVVDQAPLKAD